MALLSHANLDDVEGCVDCTANTVNVDPPARSEKERGRGAWKVGRLRWRGGEGRGRKRGRVAHLHFRALLLVSGTFTLQAVICWTC